MPRPHAIIVYGFQLDESFTQRFGGEDDGWCDLERDILGELLAKAGIVDPLKPDWPASYADWTEAQKSAHHAFNVAMDAIDESMPKPIRWGDMVDCDPELHFGILVAETDWDNACDLTGRFAAEDESLARIAAACERFGIEMQPCRLWLLAGQG